MSDRDAAAVEKALRAMVNCATDDDFREELRALHREWTTAPCPTCGGYPYKEPCPDCRTGRVPIQYVAVVETVDHLEILFEGRVARFYIETIERMRKWCRRWLEGKE